MAKTDKKQRKLNYLFKKIAKNFTKHSNMLFLKVSKKLFKYQFFLGLIQIFMRTQVFKRFQQAVTQLGLNLTGCSRYQNQSQYSNTIVEDIKNGGNGNLIHMGPLCLILQRSINIYNHNNLLQLEIQSPIDKNCSYCMQPIQIKFHPSANQDCGHWSLLNSNQSEQYKKVYGDCLFQAICQQMKQKACPDHPCSIYTSAVLRQAVYQKMIQLKSQIDAHFSIIQALKNQQGNLLMIGAGLKLKILDEAFLKYQKKKTVENFVQLTYFYYNLPFNQRVKYQRDNSKILNRLAQIYNIIGINMVQLAKFQLKDIMKNVLEKSEQNMKFKQQFLNIQQELVKALTTMQANKYESILEEIDQNIIIGDNIQDQVKKSKPTVNQETSKIYQIQQNTYEVNRIKQISAKKNKGLLCQIINKLKEKNQSAQILLWKRGSTQYDKNGQAVYDKYGQTVKINGQKFYNQNWKHRAVCFNVSNKYTMKLEDGRKQQINLIVALAHQLCHLWRQLHGYSIDRLRINKDYLDSYVLYRNPINNKVQPIALQELENTGCIRKKSNSIDQIVYSQNWFKEMKTNQYKSMNIEDEKLNVALELQKYNTPRFYYGTEDNGYYQIIQQVIAQFDTIIKQIVKKNQQNYNIFKQQYKVYQEITKKQAQVALSQDKQKIQQYILKNYTIKKQMEKSFYDQKKAQDELLPFEQVDNSQYTKEQIKYYQQNKYKIPLIENIKLVGLQNQAQIIATLNSKWRQIQQDIRTFGDKNSDKFIIGINDPKKVLDLSTSVSSIAQIKQKIFLNQNKQIQPVEQDIKIQKFKYIVLAWCSKK